MPSYRLLELTNSVVTGWYYPRVQCVTVANAAITDWYTTLPVYDYITLSVEGADVGDTVDIWVMLE